MAGGDRPPQSKTLSLEDWIRHDVFADLVDHPAPDFPAARADKVVGERCDLLRRFAERQGMPEEIAGKASSAVQLTEGCHRLLNVVQSVATNLIEMIAFDLENPYAMAVARIDALRPESAETSETRPDLEEQNRAIRHLLAARLKRASITGAGAASWETMLDEVVGDASDTVQLAAVLQANLIESMRDHWHDRARVCVIQLQLFMTLRPLFYQLIWQRGHTLQDGLAMNRLQAAFGSAAVDVGAILSGFAEYIEIARKLFDIVEAVVRTERHVENLADAMVNVNTFLTQYMDAVAHYAVMLNHVAGQITCSVDQYNVSINSR